MPVWYIAIMMAVWPIASVLIFRYLWRTDPPEDFEDRIVTFVVAIILGFAYAFLWLFLPGLVLLYLLFTKYLVPNPKTQNPT